MNKSGLVEAIADVANKPKAEINRFIDLLIDTVKLELKKGGQVLIPGFCTISVAKRAARKGRNPQTGQDIMIPEKNVIKIQAGSKLKNIADEAVGA